MGRCHSGDIIRGHSGYLSGDGATQDTCQGMVPLRFSVNLPHSVKLSGNILRDTQTVCFTDLVEAL